MNVGTGLIWAVSAFQRKSNNDYHRYRSYLSGDHPLAMATEKFREAFGGIFREFAYNICETVVDAHADRMAIEGFGADNDDISTKAQAIWDDNNMDHREGQVESEQFGMGDGYVIVDQVDNRPVIWPQLADEMRVMYSDERPGKVIVAARRWLEPDGPWRLNVYTETEIAKFTAPRKGNSAEPPVKVDAFVPMKVESEAWPLRNPVPGIVPVFHFGNNAPVNDYGVSELRNVLPLQNAINKTVLDMMVAMEFAAFPQRVALGVEFDPADTTSKDKLEQFQLGLLRILTLDGAEGKTPSIAEFAAANIAQYEMVIEGFEKKIALITKVPQNYFNHRTANAISGESKRMDESGFIAKMEDRTRAAGAIWVQVQEYCLRMIGANPAPGSIRVNWKNVAPISQEEQVRNALSKKGFGMPLKAILREAGYEPDQIETILDEKREERDSERQMFDAGFDLEESGVA